MAHASLVLIPMDTAASVLQASRELNVTRTSTNVQAVKAIHAKIAAHVLMCLGHSSVNAQGDSLALDAKQVCMQTEA